MFSFHTSSTRRLVFNRFNIPKKQRDAAAMTQFAHPRFFHAFKRLCAIVTIFAGPIFCSPSFADSWMAPTSTTIFSEDRTRQVVFTPGDGGGELVVSSISANSTNKLWSARTPNLPVGIYLSNSGSNVVTTDSWHQVGYGDYVVAIYSAKGLLAHYKLETFAPPPAAMIRSDQTSVSYWSLFPHSVSSRWGG